MKICFFERTYKDNQSNSDRINFQKFIVEKGVDVYNKTNVDQIVGNEQIELVFTHFSDRNHLKIDKKKIFIIYFGGEITNINKDFDGENIPYINVFELKAKVDELLQYLKSTQSVDRQDLKNIVFSINDDLEEILKPFTTISPFNKKDDLFILDGKESKVKDAYKAINDYSKSL